VYAKYFGATGSTVNLTGFGAALLNAFGLPAHAGGETGTASSALTDFGSWIAAGGNSGDPDSPKGWLNILVFNRKHELVDLGFVQLDGSFVQSGSTKAPHQLLSRTVQIKEPGYIYIYVSNEGAVQQDVYFDDLKVTHTKSPVIQQDDYYPFGLTFNSYQRENATPNRYQYNGKEMQAELDLRWYDYQARQFDPAIGRWMVNDPLSDVSRRWSLYAYCYDNPIRFIDPDGMLSTEVTANGDGTYKVVGGNLDDGDKGIYVVAKNGNGELVRTGEKVGESLTTHSFYNADVQDGEAQTGWKGTIDTNSESGDLVSTFKAEAEDVGIVEYMANATDGKKYDFKRNGDPDNNDRELHHRGALYEVKSDGIKVYASARDAGNVSAGYIAGLNGLSWLTTRVGFDGLELSKSGSTEALQSTKAQKIGHSEGHAKYKKSLFPAH
jgi:RHS repeat-associated protein